MQYKEKKCKECNILFPPKKVTQTYCNRKCYEQHYKKGKIEANKLRPKYICWNCRYLMQLDFDPAKMQHLERFNHLVCPNCSAVRGDDPTFTLPGVIKEDTREYSAKDIVNKFLLESNLIEGEERTKAMQDARRAWRFLQEEPELSIDVMLKTHNILMRKINKDIAGRFRNVDVMVGWEICPNWLYIPGLLEEWLRRYGNKTLEEDDIKKAHIALMNIHPFQDGNGRWGRIILNWQRVKNGYPILIIKNIEKETYYDWWKDKNQIGEEAKKQEEAQI